MYENCYKGSHVRYNWKSEVGLLIHIQVSGIEFPTKPNVKESIVIL